MKYALIAPIFCLLLARSPAAPPDYASAQPEGLAAPGPQSALDEHWSDFQSALTDRGFNLGLTYEGEVFGNWGGARQGVIADGLLGAALDVNLERLTGFWKDAVFHTNILYIYGPGLSARYVGDFSNTSNLSGYNTFRLQELWLQQGFWLKRATLRAGLLAADTEFFGSQASSLFINSTFGAFNLVAVNVANAPIYPVASPGVRLDVAPTSAFDLKAAFFGMNSNPIQDNKHGAYFDINTGPLFVAEAAYLVNQSPNDRGLVGSYKLGGFIQQGDYTTWRSQAEHDLDEGPLSKHGSVYALYGIADQEIYKQADRKIELFVRGGLAPRRYSFVDGYLDAGVNFTGFVPGRESDIAGVGFSRSWVSGDFSAAEQLEGEPAVSSETVIELTYKAQIKPWWNVQPDLQFILTPGGAQGARNAAVLGLRTTLAF